MYGGKIFVHIYDDREELAREHCKARNKPYDPDADIAKTVAHEAVHAAAPLYFMDGIPGWHSRARAFLIGDHEMLAYLVGDISSEVIRHLYKLKLLH